MSNCPHGMPNPKTCLDCMEEGNLEPPRWVKGDILIAQFAGSCVCGNAIFPGDIVRRWDKEDQATKYTHITCNP